MTSEPVDLAREPGFALGSVRCDPALRSLIVGGRTIVLEPRVMQVLVALAREPGRTVGRQALIDSCWDGRIVGDDVINRALLKLRQAAAESGDGFRVETVRRVGYRLTVADSAAPAVDRRRWLIGAGAAGAVLAAGAGTIGYLHRRRPDPAIQARARELYERGETAFQQGSRDDNAQAVGFFEQAAALDPDSAPILGALALAYRFEQALRPPALLAQTTALADRAMSRALALDPNDPDGIAAQAMYVPFRNHWLETEQRMRAGLRKAPSSAVLNSFVGILLATVGRTREAIVQMEVAASEAPFTPMLKMHHIRALFASGKIGSADAQLDKALALYPTFSSLWWERFWIYALTGRTEQAAGFLGGGAATPGVLSPSQKAAAQAALTAIERRDPASVGGAIEGWRAQATAQQDFWPFTIALTTNLGRLDEAVAMVAAYLDPYYHPEQPRRMPGTYFLFSEALAPLRRDARIGKILAEIGLVDYWRRSRSRPDEQVAGLGI